MKKLLPVANGLALVLTVVVNYFSNSGVFNGNTMATISARYSNLFTPAPYAFSIWGFIYFGLFCFVIYQGRSLFGWREAQALRDRIGWWFFISCIANSAWVLAWLYDLIGLSVLIMIVLLVSLFQIILRIDMELTDPPLRTIAFVWWPFSLYSGWISVAFLANVAAWMVKLNAKDFAASEGWAISLIIVAGILHLFMTWRRNMREFAFVGVWALVAIAVANADRSRIVMVAALSVAGILFFNSCAHAYKNRLYSPWRKRHKE